MDFRSEKNMELNFYCFKSSIKCIKNAIKIDWKTSKVVSLDGSIVNLLNLGHSDIYFDMSFIITAKSSFLVKLLCFQVIR